MSVRKHPASALTLKPCTAAERQEQQAVRFHGVRRRLQCRMLTSLMVARHAAPCLCTRLVSPWVAASSLQNCPSMHTMRCLIGSCIFCCRKFESYAPVLTTASDVSPTADDARGRGEPVHKCNPQHRSCMRWYSLMSEHIQRGRSPEACAAWLSNFQSCLLMPAIFLQEMLAGHMGLHAGLQPLRPLNVPAGLQASAGLQGATPCTVSNPQAWPECANACQFT